MKHILLFSLALILNNSSHSQSCAPNGVNFNGITSITNFLSNNPGCTTILGDVTISNQVTSENLILLSQITSIGGYLRIENTTQLTDLAGLYNLTNIDDL